MGVQPARGTAGSRGGAKRSYGWLLLVVSILAVVSDQLTKLWALRTLPETGAVAGGVGPIQFRLLRNPGAAFSMGEGTTWIFTIIAGLVVVGVGFYAWRSPIRSVWVSVLLGLVVGGAIGNLIDRIFQPPGFAVGHVVDFLDYAGFFVGNVADIWIVVGALGLAVYFLFQKSPQDQDQREDQDQDQKASASDGRRMIGSPFQKGTGSRQGESEEEIAGRRNSFEEWDAPESKESDAHGR